MMLFWSSVFLSLMSLPSISFCFISSEPAAYGGGGGATLSDFLYLISFSCSADQEQDWPPCDFFFNLINNTLNLINN